MRWFDRIGLSEGTLVQNKQGIVPISREHREDLFSFGIAPYFKDFPQLLNDPFIMGVARIATELQGYERKVGNKIYMRHVFAVLGESWNSALKPYAHETAYMRVTVAALLLHDALELQKKYGTGVTAGVIEQKLLAIAGAKPNEVAEIMHLVDAFTPTKTASKIPDDRQWAQVKVDEFEREMALDMGPRTIVFHHMKAADMAANIRETVTDYKLGFDKGMDRPIYPRILVFHRRIDYYMQIHDPHDSMVPVLEQVRVLLDEIIIPLAEAQADTTL